MNDAPTPTLNELTRTFARVGVLSFGGPAAQIALMHRMILDEKRWVSEADYLRALSQQQERDRSFCINAIVREHAERHGHPLPPPTASVPSSPPGER